MNLGETDHWNMFIWEKAIIEGKPNSKVVFGCAHCISRRLLREKKADAFLQFFLPHVSANLVSNNRRFQ